MTDEIEIDRPVTEADEPEVPHLAPTYAPSPTAEEAIRAFANGPRTELRLIELEGPRGEGKLGRVSDLLLTPSGWIKFGDVQVGDLVIAGDGSPTEVLGVFPQPVQQLWRLKFSDGAEFVTSDDHQWAVETKWDRDGHKHQHYRSRAKTRKPSEWRLPRIPRTGLKVVSTEVIRKLLQRGAWERGGRWSIPLVGPVQLVGQPVPLDPYLLGALLGDGGMGQPKGIRFSSSDADLVAAIEIALPEGHTLRRVMGYDYAITGTCRRGPGTGYRYERGSNVVLGALRDLGLLGHRSHEKFIPDVYLWNEPAVRLAVLQGLLDTDATISKHSNSVSYSTTSERLAEGVEFLVRSLGGLTRRRLRQTYYSYKGEQKAGRPSYNLTIRLPNGVAPFRLARKAKLVTPKGKRNEPRRFIVGIEAAGCEGGVCIQVAHRSGLYVATDQFIVTHNTTAGIWCCAALAERVIADGYWRALPIKVGLIRDTWVNIQRTTVDAFKQARVKGAPLEFFRDEHECVLYDVGGRPLVHFYFFGLDRPDQADNLQGFQCAVLWLEEIAPAATMSAGIPAEALGLGVTSVRQELVPGRILLTFNPPPPDHWVVKIEQTLEVVGLKNIRIAKYKLAPGEKSAHFRSLAEEAETPEERKAWLEAAEVFDAYRERNRIFLTAIGREDLATRLVLGERGAVQEGEALVKSFSREHHVTKQPIPIIPGVPILRFWDAGLTPSVVWAQAGPDWMNILGSRRSDHGGMEQHILNHVLPFQEKYGISRPKKASGFGQGAHAGFEFEDIGDPACLDGSQVNSEQTVARIIEAYLGTFFQPGPVEWSARREALQSAFWRKGGGGKRMFILIDPDENEELIQSLEGRAHFPKDVRTGRVVETVEALKRASGTWFQTLDALAYGLAFKFPADEWMAARLRELAPKGPTQAPPASWLGR